MYYIVKLVQWIGIELYRRLAKKRFCLKKYCGREFISIDQCNRIISEAIKKGDPYMIGRFGGYELSASVKFEKKMFNPFPKSVKQHAAYYLCTNAGFFPSNLEGMYEFSNLMKRSTEEIDLIAVWFNPMEDYWLKKYALKDRFPYMVNTLCGLEPWYSACPWTLALEGKKVLVIHPFAETILSQYQRREKLFSDTQYLPHFELHVLKAVQSIGGDGEEHFANWFQALQYMYEEAIKIDFNVAIIGCGAYGFPLAAKLKKSGKVVIHMGGATQLLFGIMGDRWKNNEKISSLCNEYWVRPNEKERPKGAEKVEGACYW